MADEQEDPQGFFEELKRRRVWRVTAAYVVAGFAVLEAADIVIPSAGLPEWTLRLVVVLVLLGFPVAVLLAWAFDVTPGGLLTTPSRGPRRSHPVVLAIFATLVAVTVGWFVWPRASVGDADSDQFHSNRVAIPAFANQATDPSLSALGEIASDWISSELMEVPELSVVPGRVARDVVAADTSGSPLETLATDTRAAILVVGSYFTRGDSVQISAQILESADLDLLYTVGPHSAAIADATAALAALGHEVAGRLSQHMAWGMPETLRLRSSAPSYEAFVEYTRATEHTSVLRWRDAIPILARATELAPEWVAPHSLLFWAYSNLGYNEAADSLVTVMEAIPSKTRLERLLLERLQARVEGDLQRDYVVLQALAEIDPWGFLYPLAYVADYLNRPEEAIRHFSRVDEIIAGQGSVPWFSWWVRHCDALHKLGRHEEALAVARDGLRYHPRSRRLRRVELVEMAALGRFEEAAAGARAMVGADLDGDDMGRVFRAVGRAVALHGGPPGLARELLTESVAYYESFEDPSNAIVEAYGWLAYFDPSVLERAETFSRDYLDRYPSALWILGPLGAIAARRGDPERAREYLARLESLPGRELGQARIYAALGEFDAAVAKVEEAVDAGLAFAPFLHTDPYIQLLTGHPEFEELMRPVG